ncbi:MAG: NUDIX domain-containing protein [Candidatus Aenigmarchaeota archaeon]|nr:NUDIX domain-containing protein [Candidatus Aenigmarchaeota archaeon]
MSQGVSGAGLGIMLVRDDKILLGKRTDDVSKGTSELKGEGTWTLPGGKLHFKESFEDALVREVNEETGIDLISFEIICVSNEIAGEKHFVTIGAVSEEFEGEANLMEPEEITEWQWFSLDELPEKLFIPSKNIIENYKEGTFCRD